MLVRAARLRPGRPRGARASRSSAGTGTAIPTTRQGRRSRSRCASCTSATTWRRSAASSRRSAPSRPPASAATGPTTRRSPTCSSSMDATGSIGSPRSSRGTPCSPSSRSLTACSSGAELDDALTVAADFIDLKSPYMGGHSRRCAELAARRRPGARARRGRRHDAPPRGARARLRHHRRAELDLGQARPAHPVGVRPGRAAPDADRADAAPLAGSRRPEPGRLRAPREVRRVGLPQARAGRRRRSRRVRPRPRRRSTSG